MNCFRPSTVIPLLRTPLTVGKRGSSLGEEMTWEGQQSIKCHQKGKRHLSHSVNPSKPTIRRHIPAPRTRWASSWRAPCCWGWVWRTPRCTASWCPGRRWTSRTARRGRGTRWSWERGSLPPDCPRWDRQSHMSDRLWEKKGVGEI